jgi:hypothetical protein
VKDAAEVPEAAPIESSVDSFDFATNPAFMRA